MYLLFQYGSLLFILISYSLINKSEFIADSVKKKGLEGAFLLVWWQKCRILQLRMRGWVQNGTKYLFFLCIYRYKYVDLLFFRQMVIHSKVAVYVFLPKWSAAIVAADILLQMHVLYYKTDVRLLLKHLPQLLRNITLVLRDIVLLLRDLLLVLRNFVFLLRDLLLVIL